MMDAAVPLEDDDDDRTDHRKTATAKTQVRVDLDTT